MNRGFFLGAALSLGLVRAAQAAIATPPAQAATKPLTAADPGFHETCGNLKIEVDAEYQDMRGLASLIVSDGSQVNQIVGGEKRVGAAEGKDGRSELKKYGFIFNAVPACDPEKADAVAMEFQVELSSPSANGADMRVWQVQSRLTFKKGHRTMVIAKPARVFITVSEAKPE